MKLSSSIALFALLSTQAFSAPTTITVQETKALIESKSPESQLLILDTRGGYKDYISGHIPTAHHINFDTLRGTDASGVPVQYLPDSMTKELLRRAGVNENRPTILYAEGGTGDEILSTTMVAYVLEKMGVQDIRILDGGLPEFKKTETLSQKYPTTMKAQLPKKMKKDIGVDVQFVLKSKAQKDYVLVDARPENEYLGQDTVWPRKGHIPGAISFPWRKVMTEDNTHKFKSREDTQKELTSAGLTADKKIIVYCGTSREGSLLRFYLAHVLKYPNVQLYEGSWKEYSALENLPAETKPTKLF